MLESNTKKVFQRKPDDKIDFNDCKKFIEILKPDTTYKFKILKVSKGESGEIYVIDIDGEKIICPSSFQYKMKTVRNAKYLQIYGECDYLKNKYYEYDLYEG